MRRISSNIHSANKFFFLSFQRRNKTRNNALCQCISPYRIGFQARGRLTDIPLSFYQSARWNPLTSPQIDDTHQSATRQCEISENDWQEERKDRSDGPMNDNGSRVIGYVKLSLYLYLFFEIVLVNYTNIYLSCNPSFM